MKRTLSAALIASHLFGCATLSNRTKNLMLAGGTAGVGATAGALTAPGGERPEMHAVLWGAVGGLVGAVVGLFIFDESANSDELKRQNSILQKELEDLRPDTMANLGSSHETTVGRTYVRDELPASVKSLVRPGQWTHSIFPQDHWVPKNEHLLVRECEAFTYVPPTLQVPAIRLGPSTGQTNEEKENETK